MTLEEIIKQRLEEASKEMEASKVIVEEKQEELKTLTEEDLEAMSQEEFDSIDEEQLDELSKGTLISYVKKAGASAGKAYASKKFGTMTKLFGSKEEKANLEKDNKKADLTIKNRFKGLAGVEKRIPESSGVSDQVASLLEAEGLSEEFKVQAVTIFEAAVTDRVLQIQEELESQYNEKLDEARAEVENNIDGFLNEVVQQWAKDNEVAIASNFKTRLAESFMDGLQGLLIEHNIDLPAEKVDALDAALEQVHTLEESATAVQATIAQLEEQVAELKANRILESFKEKMTSTEFDRFVQLTESVKFKDEAQYEKQLSIVLENFGKVAAPKVVAKQPEVVAPQIVEEVASPVQPQTIVTEQNTNVNIYAKYLADRAGKF